VAQAAGDTIAVIHNVIASSQCCAHLTCDRCLAIRPAIRPPISNGSRDVAYASRAIRRRAGWCTALEATTAKQRKRGSPSWSYEPILPFRRSNTCRSRCRTPARMLGKKLSYCNC